MFVLGLESSCDETAAAVVKEGQVYSSVVRTQIDLHQPYGGVVPEIASRAHLEAVDLVAKQALNDANIKLADLGAIAVTKGPGLVGALLVALNFAKGLAASLNIPLVGVNHVKAHALSAFMVPQGEPLLTPKYPLAALVVSGGHTNLYKIDSPLDFHLMGRTRDDAAGEAFDKTSKLMGLGYPGGAVIEKLAKKGNPKTYNFTRPMLGQGFDFSFSGLKTQVLNLYNKEFKDKNFKEDSLSDLAASFQAAVNDVLTSKLKAFALEIKAKSAVLAGGVAANGDLRDKVAYCLGDLPLYLPPLKWCADNGAMVAYLGSYQIKSGDFLNWDAEALPRWF